MFPIFLAGLGAGAILTITMFQFLRNIPSNAKLKLQEEQLKGAQADLRMFEEELTKAKEQIEKLKAEKQKTKTTKKKEN